MGKVQTSSRGSTKQAGRWTWTGVCVGAGQKETQTAQGHRRSTKETRASVRIAGSRWRQPRAQDYRLRQRRCRRRHLRAQGTPEAYGKVGNAMMQENNRISRSNGRGLLRRRSHRFYTTAERRGTAMKKGI